MKKTILLTGATDGIGLRTAYMLAAEGHILLLHGRNPQKLADVKMALQEKYPQGQVTTYVADLSVLSEVKGMANEILANHKVLDVLINNAGVLIAKNPIADSGLDVRFVVNTIAPYILTKMLLPILAMEARIVNLSSAAQMPMDFGVWKSGGALEAHTAYAQSKLAITMWSMKLAKELAGKAVVVAINPKSFLGSKMVREGYGKKGYDLQIGADILYRGALSAEFAHANGMYYDNDYGMFANPHPYATKESNRLELMNYLEQFV